ncbi:hypothetical protein GCM10009850_090220 [Nonomuraea monospora]|uniref:Carrier domain-containing protein n=1 Tax=Nonomuraea monospora TaxID=568818 RepID=A0ABN3CVQ6_9ACTN
MTATAVAGQVHAFIRSRVGGRDIGADTDIFEEGLVDSLFAMELITFVETTFGLSVLTEDLDRDNFCSVHAITRFVLGKNGAAARRDPG